MDLHQNHQLIFSGIAYKKKVKARETVFLPRFLKLNFSTGVVTSLDDSGGEINGVHDFTKIVAKSDWNNLKVGSKLKFLLFEGSVRHMELLDSGWDEDEAIVIPPNKDIAGFSTDKRTVKGTIADIQNDILTVDIGGNNEQLIALEDHPELKWEFSVGDNVTFIIYKIAFFLLNQITCRCLLNV